jgi:hypothetical protein
VDDGTAHNADLVLENLARMHSQTKPQTRFRATHSIVLAQACHDLTGRGSGQETLGHLRWDRDQGTIAAILSIAAVAWNLRSRECLTQYLIHTVTRNHLMRVGPAPVAEPFYTNDEDRTVHRERKLSHICPARSRYLYCT